jgi:hypothetical protein
MSDSVLSESGLRASAGTEVRAGPLRARYEAGTVRYVTLGGHELIRQVYAAVRDHNWGTVPAELHDEQIDVDEPAGCFTITFVSLHQQGDIRFSWRGEIDGRPDGTICFRFDGQAGSDFLRNRIGFCVLHPASAAGKPCVVTHTGGTRTESAFPQTIMPHQPFLDVAAIRHEATSGVWCTVTMEGDIFETEDQRNWTDASFKTYCTPLSLPFPVQVSAGDRVSQKITIQAQASGPAMVTAPQMPTITVTTARTLLPAVGIGANEDGVSLSGFERETLRDLKLAHLRVELRAGDTRLDERMRAATSDSAALSCPLELAVFVAADPFTELRRIADAVQRARPDIARWLVFQDRAHATSPDILRTARTILSPFDAPIGGGTDAFFTELNRNRPDTSLLDCVSYSINPQVHAFDHATLVETLETQGETVRTAQTFCGGKPLVVSPITLKMRWNPNATGPEKPTPPVELPRRVDVRQMQPFGAVWTLGSIRYLAEAGASSLTYYEATGWLGVMERESGSPLPDLFPSQPGTPFPLFHVLSAVNAFAGGSVVHVRASHPLAVDALMLERAGVRRLTLANMTASPQTARVEGPGAASITVALSAYEIHAVQSGSTHG